MLPAFLKQIQPDQDFGSVPADNVCGTRKFRNVVAVQNAHTLIPLCKDTKLWKPDKFVVKARNEAVRLSKYLGQGLCPQLTIFYCRSRIKTKMH